MRRTVILAAVAALALGACGKTTAIKDPDAGTAAANTLTVKAHEYMFDVSGTPKTGPVSVAFSNTGKELHHGIVGKIGEGKTLADLKAYIESGDQGPPPEWFDDSPTDVNLVSPGESSTISFELKDAGTYVLLCFMPSPDGAPHIAKGMMASFDVAEGKTDATLPKADETVEMSEYKFAAPELHAGEVTLEFKNTGKEHHEFMVVRFAEGKGLGDVDPWFEGGQKGPAPVEFFGGTHDFGPGESRFFTATLEPGTYTFVCGAETEDGKKHADDLGMVTEVKVA